MRIDFALASDSLILFSLDSMTRASEAGLDDAKFYMLHRMPWGLSRPRFMDFQRKHIEQLATARPEFPRYLRQAALDALQSEDAGTVRRGLTALAFVGDLADLPKIRKLYEAKDADIPKDVQTCIFEIELRHRGV